MKTLTIEDYTRFDKVIFSSEILFLERLCSTMLFDNINELDKNQFVTNILKANKTLEKPLAVNEQVLNEQINQMIEKKEILDLNDYYFISITPERRNEILSVVAQEERKTYFNLITSYVKINQTENNKVKRKF